jgi:ATP/maltotriose-dependent transcriptional regulator MalT
MQTAILDRFNSALCDVFTTSAMSGETGQQRLARLEGKGFFMVMLVDDAARRRRQNDPKWIKTAEEAAATIYGAAV